MYRRRPAGFPNIERASPSAVTFSAVSSSTLANHFTESSMRSSSVLSPKMVLDVSRVSRATTTGNRGSGASLTMTTRPAASRSHPFQAAAITSWRPGWVMATKATLASVALTPRAHGACGRGAPEGPPMLLAIPSRRARKGVWRAPGKNFRKARDVVQVPGKVAAPRRVRCVASRALQRAVRVRVAR